MMLRQNLKNCIAMLRFLSESQRYRHVVIATTVVKTYRRIAAFVMQIAVMILKKDRKLKMPEKDPSNYPLITYLWIFVLAAWGGLVSFINKVKAGEARRFNISELIGELATSAFAGMLTFWICELGNLPPLLTAAFVGISGHMGSRLIFKAEKALDRYLERKFDFLKPKTTERTENGADYVD